MYPLFETVCVGHGAIQHAHYHEQRFLKSYLHFFGKEPDYSLFDTIELPKLDKVIKYKLKVSYAKTGTNCSITQYNNPIPVCLQMVVSNSAAYDHKFTDRKHLNTLYGNRKNADDVLIIKNGCITDASYANIVFKKGDTIHTPKNPLLHGTCRARLIAENRTMELEIKPNQLEQYNSFQLINAMNDLDETRWVDIKYIKR